MNISPLQKGDKIAIVSTARKITFSELEPAINILNSWGLKVVLGKTIGLSYHQFAGTDTERSADFQTMLNRTDIKAIICARGGYGTVRVIDSINFNSLITTPKWIIGYSDVTVLHAHISHLNIPTIHGTMPINFENNTPAALLSLKKALFGENINYTFKSHSFNKVGTAKGNLIGGNLSIIYSLLGSESDINTDGKILILEDLDEYLYHIDRMLQALKRSGKLTNLAGLIIGGMTGMNDNTIPFGKTAVEIIQETVAPYNYPVCYNAPFGHINDNRSFILKEAKLTVAEREVLLEF